jgi:hypothetical protein
VNPNETILSPSIDFRKLQAMTYTTDGLIYAQPLYIEGLYGSNGNVGACPHPTNAVFVATENNSVYGLEAPPLPPSGGGNVCWQVNLNQSGETAIPYTSLPSAGGIPCKNLTPWVGITGTPVIDVTVTPPILYVVTSHQEANGTSWAERLHAIYTTTGQELPGSPFDIGSALSPYGFSILAQNQRPGLALTHPTNNPSLAYVYVSWASNCDYNSSLGNYDGWVAGFQYNYSAQSNQFQLLGSFTSEPTTGQHEGGIWMAGSAPAIDNNGNVYVAVGNGAVNPPSQTSLEWGNSVLKLPYNLGTPPLHVPLDFYTPNDWFQLDNGSGATGICFAASPSSQSTCPPGPTNIIAADTDMGTGGVVLLSSSQLFSIGKEGIGYVVPYSATSNGVMGGLDGCGYNCSSASQPTAVACSTLSGQGNIAQCFEAALGFSATYGDRNGVWGAPAFWSTSTQSYLYAIGLHDYMYWYPYSASNSPPFTTASPATSDHSFCGPNNACINSTKPGGRDRLR